MNGKICATCQIELVITTNDVAAVEMASWGVLKIWSADLYTCSSCNREVLLGFSRKAEVITNCSEVLLKIHNDGKRQIWPFWLNKREYTLFIAKYNSFYGYLDTYAIERIMH